MTTATVTPAPQTEASAWTRIMRIVRLITANPGTILGWPLAILAVIFAGTLTIWWLIRINLSAEDAADMDQGVTYNGAATYIFVYMLVIAVQAVNQSFPLALGMGSTRRAFSVGSAVTFTALSVLYGTIMVVGAWLEDLTDGWGGMGGFFRSFVINTDAGWAAQWWLYFCWFVFFFFTGTIFAAVFVRWKARGLALAFMALAALGIGTAAWLTFTSSWGQFGEALVSLGTLGVASVMLIPGVISAVIGALILSRATPRS